MSMTAQRKDISDPEVIYTFAKQVQDITHLDYLYVLTVADINATNNTLWNNWRATLMRKLYVDTKLALQRGLETPVNRQDLIDQVQQEALSMLGRRHVDTASVTELWSNIGEDYFLQETATNGSLAHRGTTRARRERTALSYAVENLLPTVRRSH